MDATAAIRVYVDDDGAGGGLTHALFGGLRFRRQHDRERPALHEHHRDRDRPQHGRRHEHLLLRHAEQLGGGEATGFAPLLDTRHRQIGSMRGFPPAHAR